jgi:hypothetical protein
MKECSHGIDDSTAPRDQGLEMKMEQITITLESLKSIKGDVNKKVSTYLKQHGISVVEADVIVLCANEPGRCWIKKPGQTSCVAYG